MNAPERSTSQKEIVAKLRQVDVLVSQGQSVAEAVRSIGVTQFTYYRWRKEFGGLKTDQVKRLKDLEKENERLRKAVSDLTLERADPSGGRLGKLLSPARRRACVDHVREKFPGVGTVRLSRARTASFDPAEGAARAGR